MRAHRGMRPHDIILLLKLTHSNDRKQLSLSSQLFMSQSEISDSLGRSQIAGLIDGTKQNVYKNNLMEFLRYGLKYVFPAIPGRVQRGIPTAFSVSSLRSEIAPKTNYVWPYFQGEILGESITPFHKNQHLAALKDEELYKKLALVDAIRLRNPRETEIAVKYLNEIILNE